MKINDIAAEGAVIRCWSKDEARKVCELLKNKGLIWNSGASLDTINWIGTGMWYGLIKVGRQIRVIYGQDHECRESVSVTCNEFIKNNVSILDISHRKIRHLGRAKKRQFIN